jgi:hypothetical protein
MGDLGYLEHRGLEAARLEEALCLEEHEILFFTGPPDDNTVDGEPDLDLILLTDERGFRRRAESFAPERRARGQRRRAGVIYEHVAGVDIDVEVHLLSTYEELLEALSALEPWTSTDDADGFDALGSLPREAAVELLFQLGTGRAATNEGAFEELRARLDLRKLSAWNIQHALHRSRSAIADAEQSLRRSDVENAYLKLSAAYDALGDAMLFARGEGADRWRWRLPRLRALGPSSFLDRYLDVMLLRRGPSEPLCAFVARQLDAAQGVAESLRHEAQAAPP